jgi:putative lipoic acid-binding regulatory protein
LDGERDAYPAVFHFRIIVEAGAAGAEELTAAAAPYRVTSAVAPSASSPASGRYRSFAVSVNLASRAEMAAFDADVRRVPGVRMLL